MSVFADILVLAVLIAAAWLGAKRGLLKSLAGLLIIVVAPAGGPPGPPTTCPSL